MIDWLIAEWGSALPVCGTKTRTPYINCTPSSPMSTYPRLATECGKVETLRVGEFLSFSSKNKIISFNTCLEILWRCFSNVDILLKWYLNYEQYSYKKNIDKIFFIYFWLKFMTFFRMASRVCRRRTLRCPSSNQSTDQSID